jgi:hypothetical protein
LPTTERPMTKEKPAGKARSSPKRPLEITFSGDVFTIFFEIDNHEVTLHGDPGGGFKRTFEDFPPGSINILLHVKGLNTTAWALTLKYDGKPALAEQGHIQDGFSHLVEPVTLK